MTFTQVIPMGTNIGGDDTDSETLVGDVDLNGTVNADDLVVFSKVMNGADITISKANADIDGNGYVNSDDYLMLSYIASGNTIE